MRGKVEYADEICAVATCGGVFITIHRKPSTMKQLGEVRRLLGEFFARGNVGGGLSVLEQSSLTINADKAVRQEMVALTRDFPSRCSAIVLEGTGFKAAAGRAMLSGVYLLSRPSYPYKITGSLDEAATWVATTAGTGAARPPIDPRDLIETCEKARAAIS